MAVDVSDALDVSSGSRRSHRLEVDGLLVADLTFAPRLHLLPHHHQRGTLALVLAGGFASTAAGASRDCPAATMVAEPAGAAHDNRFGAVPARVVVIQPSAERAARLGLVDGGVPRCAAVRAGVALALGQRLSREVRCRDDLSPLAVEGLALEALALCGRELTAAADGPVPPGWLRDVEGLLHARFRQRIDRAELAAVASVHPVHLARTFRARHRMTIAEYVRGLRLDWAATRLVTTDLPIAEIAQQAGFTDQSHLTRTFSARYGATPARYRALTFR